MSISTKSGMYAGLFCLFNLSSGLAQEASEAPTEVPAQAEKPAVVNPDEFESMLSLGYRPAKGSSTLGIRYLNISQIAVLRVFSGTTLKITDLADYSSKSSSIALTYRYGLSDKVNIGISTKNSFSKKAEYKYTTSAKANGNVDFSTNRSGAEEPNLYLDYVFSRAPDLLIVGDFTYSPKTGDATTSNSLRGGSSNTLGLNIYKAIGVFEYGGGIHIESLSDQTSKSDTSTTDTSGGNRLTIDLSINMYVTPNASLIAQGAYTQVSSATDKVSNQTNTIESDSYGIGTIVLGYQYALSKNLIFEAAITGASMDSLSAKQGTSKLIQDETSATGVGAGLKFGF